MSILIDRLPTTVMIDGKEYAINFDHRTSMLFELMLQDGDFNRNLIIPNALKLYYPVIPDNIDEAVSSFLWFYKCGESLALNEEASEELVYSYEYDGKYIYSAFLEQYGIDLQEETLHWWKFKALFDSLDSECEFLKIVGYRTIKISSKMSSEEREFYSRMKEIHALPISEKEQNENDLITEALMNGGDLSGIL